jgi:hypothetical protein
MNENNVKESNVSFEAGRLLQVYNHVSEYNELYCECGELQLEHPNIGKYLVSLKYNHLYISFKYLYLL